MSDKSNVRKAEKGEKSTSRSQHCGGIEGLDWDPTEGNLVGKKFRGEGGRLILKTLDSKDKRKIH